MKHLRAIITLFIITSLSLNAQIFDPVSWNYKAIEADDGMYILRFTAEIEDTWHMYGTILPEGGPIATSFNFTESDKYSLAGDLNVVTKPKSKFDKSFEMELDLHDTKAVFEQRIKRLTNEPFDVEGYVEFMSCDDERCLPPKEVEFSFSFDAAETVATATDEKVQTSHNENRLGEAPVRPQINVDSKTDTTSADEIEAGDLPVTETGPQKDTVASKSLWGIFLISLLAGLAGLLTPCVYPMIPMTVSFFMQGERTRGRAIAEGIFFGFSIMAVYTLIGLLVALTGSNFTSTLNTHWIPNLIFFGLFLVFALSFFGLFEIVLPSGLANKFDQRADKGGFLGPFFMALTTVIVSFSCTGPIVGTLLVKAVQGEILEPVVGMFGFGLVFALPFTLFAIFPNMLKSLPKSGGWLNTIKVVLGFIILAFALKFVSNIDQTYHLNILSRPVFLSIWIALFGLTGLYLLGKFKLAHDSDLPYLGVTRLLFAIASFSFMVYLIPGLFGAPVKGISSFLPPAETSYMLHPGTQTGGITERQSTLCSTPTYADKLHLPHGLEGYFVYEEGMACAIEQNKPLFIDFKGHVCSNCKKMENEVWSDPAVLDKLRNDFVIVALYTDDKTKLPEEEWVESPVDGKIKMTMGKINETFQIEKYGTNSIPLYAIVDHNGELLTEGTYGYDPDVSDFLEFLNTGIKNFKEE